jgi:hypothetical protein
MGRKLAFLALGAVAVAYVLSSRRRVLHVGDPGGNGGSASRSEQLKRLVGEARERLRANTPRS